MTYGSLGSGILTGKYTKRPTFMKHDARAYFYPYYKEPHWSLARRLVAQLNEIAVEKGVPVAQVALNWITQQPGISTAIAGARTPEQVKMNAAACEWVLSEDDINRIKIASKRIFTGNEKQKP